ncbi:MAG TPA: pilus assembly protein TadG-related protein, partial [Candidatus Baltobacteraceae bacterium]|nr:pilus assembly protein TadG-related protein [Candidatus Baltobacteraceae bacterium]
MRLNRLESQRGQTMPFWVIGVLVALSAMFFLSNYVNAVVWQIRAQNAADAAASTSLAVTANMWNEETTILYAAAVDEYRIRYLNQALINTIDGVGCSPATCSQDYTTLRSELGSAISGYDADVQLLRQGNNFSEGGQTADQQKVENIIGNDCATAADYTCQFKFTKTAASLTNFYKK